LGKWCWQKHHVELIARVLKPTNGRVLVIGKVAPLLEYGAGFHPDLTGRENMFLNGALLGFTREEMMQNSTGIVDFAELWDFIDVPCATTHPGCGQGLALQLLQMSSRTYLICRRGSISR